MKKIHRFLVASIPNTPSFSLSDTHLVHQARSVLALRSGEDIILFIDGGNDEVVTIEEITKDALTVTRQRIVDTAASRPALLLTVAVSIPKGTTLELIVQKLTELGVREVVPLISARTVKGGIRKERLQTISDEALEQCGGGDRVRIHDPLPLAETLAQFPLPALVCEYGGAPLFDAARPAQGPLMLYIGPEGGWDEKDLHLFEEAGISKVSLGGRILRTDTAAIVAAHVLLWQK